jgi:hypothetical protein
MRYGGYRLMKNSAAPSTASFPVRSALKEPRPAADRHAAASEPIPIRWTWTDELERRRRAVARWRGSEEGLKD